MTVYDVTLSTLTPLHIGTGEVMRQDLDFMPDRERGQTIVLRPETILAEHFDDLEKPGLHQKSLCDYVTGADRNNPAFQRYILPGLPRAMRDASEVRTAIKDPFDVPYVPGSSLKGALRTGLAWAAWRDAGRRWSPGELGRQGAWAAQGIERELFGRDPNHDLLRALKVSDLHGPTQPGERLRLINAEARTVRGGGAPISLEAVTSDTTFNGQLVIDEQLFGEASERILQFGGRRVWLEQLAERIHAHARSRLELLADFFEHAEGGGTIAAFYRKLVVAQLSAGRMLVQLGWGGGWDSKTFGSHLREPVRAFEEVIDTFRLQRRAKGAPQRKPGDRFPASRRVAVSIKGGVSLPAAPLGWCLLEMKARDEARA